MMSKVVNIVGDPVQDGTEAVPYVVEFCETLLASAKSGHLRAIATAEVHGRQGAISHGFAHGNFTDNILAGAIMLLTHAFCQRKFERG